MLTTEDFDALRPYADNFDAAPPHLIRKLDAHIADLNKSVHEELGTTQPPLPPLFAERNRKNAQKSTGPKSAAGKAAASQNRLAHGLCAKSLLIAGETEDDFEALRRAIVAAHQPANAEETLLTDQVAQTLWRYNRAQRIESTYLLFGQTESQRTLTAHGLDRPSIDKVTELQGDSLTTGLFMRESSYKNFERIQRYLTTAERSYHRALKLLQQAQERRRKLPQPAAPVSVQPEAEPRKPETLKAAAAGASVPLDHESGFVPQNNKPPAEYIPMPLPIHANRTGSSHWQMDGDHQVGDDSGLHYSPSRR